ncbi:MAG: AAA family ATPase [Candidatus Omnitrophota bacterium]
MFLRELEIFGFKSFPEKTTLKFEAGITVIVGPNGCGKSNVLDALKWSLGEQSAKSLRGTKMEDIIFNGTENHPPLSYAEVTLSFDNQDNYLPIEYKEVAVTRRLYRSGESEYLINKNPVRLKDVEGLFMGTGLGESTYSFIEQGKIEVFLSYKPEDKRLIFDEASGIVKYKESRRETLKKLEETDENLLRLEDIISEVKRQIRYLERQVEKTRKFKECQERLIEVEKQLAALKFSDLEKKINVILEELNTLKTREVDKEKNLKEYKEKWDELNTALNQLRKQLQEVSSQVFSLNAQIETSLGYIKVSQQRIQELNERNQTIEQNKQAYGQRLILQDKRLEEERTKLASIATELTALVAHIEVLRQENVLIEKDTSEVHKKIGTEKMRLLELEERGVQLRNSLVEIQTNTSSFTNRKKRLLLDKAKIEGFSAEKKEILGRLQKNLSEFTVQLAALKDKRNVLLSKEQELIALREQLQQELIKKEKEQVELNSYYEFLRDLRTKYDTFSAKRTVTVVFNEEPKNINKLIVSLKGVTFEQESGTFKAVIEAKVISFEEEQLQEKLNIIQRDIEDIKRRLVEVEQQKKQVSEETSAGSTQLEEQERLWQRTSQEKENIERECLRFSEEFELVEKELTANRQDLENYERKQKDLEGEIAGSEEQLQSAKSNVDGLQEQMSKNTARTNELDVEIAKSETHKQSLYREKESLDSKILLLAEEKGNIEKALKDIATEKEGNLTRVRTLEEEARSLENSIAQDKERIQQHLGQKESCEREEAAFIQRIEEDRKGLEAIEKELEEVKSSVYNKKLEIQGLDYEKEKIKDYLMQVYHITFDAAAVQPTPDSQAQSLEQLAQDKESLKKKIDTLGEVNLVAIEEFDELKKREEFLEKQKNDLVTSKEDLKKAIQKINKISRELFLETFAKVEEEFKKNFRFLFNGGRAQLMLIDQENVLESGVEIEVQPPGKKLQNVTLLSGGEKALTTIALIFAIFRVRPSPICVLDEIDAPLDEANVDRFNHILKEFSAHSQFIVITHNKKTMSRADVLYGVTMQEKGVSKLVSVKFGENEKKPLPAQTEPTPTNQ